MTLSTFKKILSCLALGLALPTTALADAPILVTSTADAGEGSLRAALATAAASDTPSHILVVSNGSITIDSGLIYAGTAPVTVVGNGSTIQTSANATLLTASQGGDMSLVGLTIKGPGGYSINARGDLDGAAGKGIFVDVRDDQTGMVPLKLSDVTVEDVAGHGIHISDCSLADDCGGGGGGAGEGSAASISVDLSGVTVRGVGQGRFDADGLRVDERGAGSIYMSAEDVLFTGVGADGVELDEGQIGDIVVTVKGAEFLKNGDYCDPARLASFMPAEPEGAFDVGAMAEASVPGPITNSPDVRCFEREVDFYDDGTVEEYEFAIDVDDGIDIDEAGPGSIRAVVEDAVITANFDEGLDFDEEDGGNIELTLINVTADGNTDDGVKNSEEGAGDAIGVLVNVMTTNNGGVGVVFEEEDGGDTHVTTLGGGSTGNDNGETGFEIVQDDEGAGSFVVLGSQIADGTDIEGVSFDS